MANSDITNHAEHTGTIDGNQTHLPLLSAEDNARQRAILDSGDVHSAYWFAHDTKGANISALQQVVIDNDDACVYAYMFAKDIPGADIQALQQAVIERGTGWSAYMFARDVAGADVHALQNVIVKRGDGYNAYCFAKDIEGSDVLALQQVAIERGSLGDILDFIKGVPGADLQLLHKRRVEISSANGDDKDKHTLIPEDAARQQAILESRDAMEAYYFASDVIGADVPALQKIILDAVDKADNGTLKDLCVMFPRDVKGADIQAFQNKAIQLHIKDNNNAYNHTVQRSDGVTTTFAPLAVWFATDVAGADIDTLQRFVITDGSGFDAYEFARRVPGADIQALQQVVLDRGDGFDMYYFALEVDGADLVALHKRLVELHSTGADIDSYTGEGWYLDIFNKNPSIQDKLKAQLNASKHLEPEGNAGSRKHRPA